MDAPGERTSVFTSSFLSRLRAESGDSSGASVEAETAGPWTVEEIPAQPGGGGAVAGPGLAGLAGLAELTPPSYGVRAEGEEVPEVVARGRETALLAAAALPGTGRARLVRVLEQEQPEGYPLVGPAGEVLGHARIFNPDLAAAMHVLESLRRSPLALALFMASARGPALDRAGSILWLWEQAPPPRPS